MRHCLVFLLLALSFAPAKAALNTDGLPDGAVGIVGFDITAFRASKVGQAVEKFSDLQGKSLTAARQLNEGLGIDSKKDLRDLVVAVYPGPDGKIAEKNPAAIVLLRGRFQPATIDDFGEKNGIASKKAGKHRAWEAVTFAEKLTGEKPKNKAKDAYLVAHSENLIILASEECLERAVAAADRAEKAALLPAAISAKFAAVPQGWFYVYADATKMRNTKEDVGAENLSLVLGDAGEDLRLGVAADFINAEKASAMRKQIMGLQALAVLGLGNDDGKSPEEKENMALLAEVVQKIRLGGEGRTATLDLDFPADRLLKALTKVLEKAPKTPAAPAAK